MFTLALYGGLIVLCSWSLASLTFALLMFSARGHSTLQYRQAEFHAAAGAILLIVSMALLAGAAGLRDGIGFSTLTMDSVGNVSGILLIAAATMLLVLFSLQIFLRLPANSRAACYIRAGQTHAGFLSVYAICLALLFAQ